MIEYLKIKKINLKKIALFYASDDLKTPKKTNHTSHQHHCTKTPLILTHSTRNPVRLPPAALTTYIHTQVLLKFKLDKVIAILLFLSLIELLCSNTILYLKGQVLHSNNKAASVC